MWRLEPRTWGRAGGGLGVLLACLSRSRMLEQPLRLFQGISLEGAGWVQLPAQWNPVWQLLTPQTSQCLLALRPRAGVLETGEVGEVPSAPAAHSLWESLGSSAHSAAGLRGASPGLQWKSWAVELHQGSPQQVLVMCLLITVCPCACQVCRLRLSGSSLPQEGLEWREGAGEGPSAWGPRARQDFGCSWSSEPAEGLKAVKRGGQRYLHVLVPGQKAWPWAGGVVVTSAWRPQGHFPERDGGGLQCGDAGPAWGRECKRI